MSINLTITGESAKEIIRELGVLTAAFYAGLSAAAAPVPPQSEPPVNVEAAVKQTRTRKPKEVKDDVSGSGTDDTGGSAANDEQPVRPAVGEAPASGTSDVAEAVAGDAGVDTTAVQDTATTDAKLTYDELRKHVLDYVAECFPNQQARSDEFRAVCKHFETDSLKKLTEDKYAAIVAEVDRRREALKAA